ncbi:LysE family translocator [Rhizobacter sp. Root1221]|uniref:LysE family translocator n=1 Tax=Rhizobacter sp. Root1221 TaxID=1736433 RepID=UPI0006F3E6C2|nr:LysE family transporter [Rhizobacter sp. Root1221]KQV98418.1 lysine transporter LysE [Rhizobacter sp. Root1221]
MIELLAVATLTVLAVISPGADFAMVTRNSLLHGRPAGLLASLGVALGVQLHVLYTMLGVGLVLRHSPQAMGAIRLAGAVYLVWVGCSTFRARPAADGAAAATGLTAWQAVRTGFFTNALNPKTTLFVLSVYTQVVGAGTPLPVQVAYGLFMSGAHLVWFAAVAVVFSQAALRARLLQRQQQVNRVIGAVLMALGLWLAIG